MLLKNTLCYKSSLKITYLIAAIDRNRPVTDLKYLNILLDEIKFSKKDDKMHNIQGIINLLYIFYYKY